MESRQTLCALHNLNVSDIMDQKQSLLMAYLTLVLLLIHNPILLQLDDGI